MDRTGRAEDVMLPLVDLEERMLSRRGLRLPERPAWFGLAELPLSLGGYALGFAIRRLPSAAFGRLQAKVFSTLAGPGPFPLAADFKHALEGARSMYERIADRGAAPALLCALSHPPVDSEVSALNFELTLRGLETISFVRGRPTKPQFVAAVDAFALAAAPLLQQAFYPGWMTALYIPLDRQPSLRGPAMGFLLRRARPDRAAWRLLRELKAGSDVVMFLGGGIEPNSRILYPARELLSRWRKAASRRGRKLRAEGQDALEALAEGDPSPAETGLLGAEPESVLRKVGRDWGVPEEKIDAGLADFGEEFSRKTPFRRRLFRLLASKVVEKGRPLLVLPFRHGLGDKTEIALGESAVLESAGRGKLKVTTWDQGRLTSSELTPDAFARRWVSSFFD